MEGRQERGGSCQAVGTRREALLKGIFVCFCCQQLMGFVFLLLGLIPTSPECIPSGLPGAAASWRALWRMHTKDLEISEKSSRSWAVIVPPVLGEINELSQSIRLNLKY